MVNDNSIKAQVSGTKKTEHLSIVITEKEKRMLERVQKHYNVKSQTKMIQALIHSAHELINK